MKLRALSLFAALTLCFLAITTPAPARASGCGAGFCAAAEAQCLAGCPCATFYCYPASCSGDCSCPIICLDVS